MSSYDILCSSIRAERSRLTALRQPSILATYSLLDQHATSIGAQNIYQRNSSLYSDICIGGGCYVPSPAGKRISPLTKNNLFRITTAGSFLKDLGAPLDGSKLAKSGHPLMKDFGSPKTWYPVVDLLKKEHGASYHNRRGHTWWSPETLPEAISENELSAVRTRELGLPDDWVSIHAVILRIRDINRRSGILPCLPTSVEAFLSSIFLPQAESSNEPGIAIDVNDLMNIKPGRPEVVVGSLPCSTIEFLPLTLHFPGPPIVSDDLALLQALISFYRTQA